MKKFILLCAAACVFCAAKSQVASPHAIGVRLGGGSDDVGGEISYQQGISAGTRLEFDLGFIDAGLFNGFKFSLLYQFVFPISGGFNWYVGPGGSIGAWNVDEDHPGDPDHTEGMFLDADGQLGIEYNCNVPLQFSLDMRPEFGIINDDFDIDFGLGIRFLF